MVPNEAVDVETGVLFNHADSYMCKNNTNLVFKGGKTKIEVILKFKTDSSDGLLWAWYSDLNVESQQSHVWSIYLEFGRINVILGVSKQQNNRFKTEFELFDDKKIFLTTPQFNDNQYHTIKVTLSRSKLSSSNYQLSFLAAEILAGEENMITLGKNSLVTNDYFSIQKGEMCIGGVKNRGPKGPQLNSVKGCFVLMHLASYNLLEHFRLNDELLRYGSTFSSHRVIPGCPALDSKQCNVAPSNVPIFVEFDVKEFTSKPEEEETIGVSFATTDLKGVIFYRTQLRDVNSDRILLQLENGRVNLAMINTKGQHIILNSTVDMNDNKLHTAFVSRTSSELRLRVDGEKELLSVVFNESESIGYSVLSNDLYLVGLNKKHIKEEYLAKGPLIDNFEGCIVEFVYNNHRLDMSTAIRSSSDVIRVRQCF